MASASPGGDRLIGTVIADRYQIMEVLGEGGMGRVYLAEHVRMGRKSAVKVMSPNMALSADAITRFNREAANAARINHPNVAQIYDFGETADGVLYLAMEFVEGQTLREIIEQGGPLPPARAAALTRQIADALGAAHHLGIVHRDLKPDNIMVGRHHDGSDWVKVVDFGIAKTVQGSGDPGAGSQTLTTAGVSLGTPEYMSPEQLAGERLDSRTDLYSLGLVLFNMLTANLPYPKLTSRETLVRRLTSKPQTLAEVSPGMAWPPALQAALDRALAPEVADRYASVTDFGHDVAHAVAGFDPDATARVPRRTARLSGPTVRIESAPLVEPRAKSAWRAPLVAAGIALVAVGAADAAYVAYRSSHRVAPTVPASRTVAVVTPADTTANVAPQQAPKPVPDTQPAVVPQAAPQGAALAPHPAADSSPATNHAARTAARDTSAAVKPKALAVVTKQPVTAAPAVTPPPTPTRTTDSVTTPMTAAAARRGGEHNWLRANGDSGAPRVLPANATDADRIRLLEEEIRGHAMRANSFMQQGQVPQSRSEMRDMASETQMFRLLYPAVADSLHLSQLVRAAGARIFQSCQLVMADTTKRLPRNFTCQQLIPGGNRGRAGQGRMGRPPFSPFSPLSPR